MIALKRPTAIAVLGAALIGLALYLLGRWDAGIAQRENAAIASAQAWLAAGHARRAERARLLAEAQRAGARAAELAASAQRHAAADRVRDALLAQAQTAADSVPILVDQRDSARAAVASWAQAFAALTLKDIADSTRADRAQTDADSAEARIRPLLKVAECHFLGWHALPRCWSRSASLAVGIAGGAIAALVSSR